VVTFFVPRSKLGLKLPVERILQKHKCNPIADMAQLVMQKDEKGEYVLEPKARAVILKDLADRHKSKPKPHEVRQERDTKPTITIKGFFQQEKAKETPRIDLEDDPDRD
jgi:hypothetical protein